MERMSTLTVQLGGRLYPVRITEADKEWIKQAERLLNEQFHEYQLRIAGQEAVDYLAMSALKNLTELLKKVGEYRSGLEQLAKRLAQLENELDRVYTASVDDSEVNNLTIYWKPKS